MKILLCTAIVLVPLAMGSQACGSNSVESMSPIGPSRQESLEDQTGPQLMRLTGSVLDTAGRPLSGARVVIVDSHERVARRRGTVWSATTGNDGRFLLTGPFDSSETFRADKEGYVTGTLTVTCLVKCYAERSFFLERPDPSIDIAGDYTLTVTADGTCPDLPSEARMRTYTASMTPTTPTNTRYRVKLGGAALNDNFLDTFDAGIAGNFFAFRIVSFDEAFPGVAEEIGPNTYVTLRGDVTATVTPGAPVISAAFDGWIAYCALKSPLYGIFSDTDCGSPDTRLEPTPDHPVTYARCDSRNHRMALTRRP